jgi:hypothetical protein
MKNKIKKSLTIAMLIILSHPIFAQENDSVPISNSKSLELRGKESALGIRFGYFSTIALSYQQFISERSAIDVSFGYRPSGGFVRWAEDMERIGGIVTYSHYYPIQLFNNDSIYFYWSLGWHAGRVSYPNDPINGEGLQTGPLFGAGLDLRFKHYAINLGVLPGYELAIGQLENSNFILNKASGIAVRYIF